MTVGSRVALDTGIPWRPGDVVVMGTQNRGQLFHPRPPLLCLPSPPPLPPFKRRGEESSSSLSLSSVLSWRRRRYDNRCHNNADTMATETTMTTISLVFFIGEAVDRWRCRRKGERGKRGKRRKRKRKRICGFHGEAEARLSFPRRQKSRKR